MAADGQALGRIIMEVRILVRVETIFQEIYAHSLLDNFVPWKHLQYTEFLYIYKVRAVTFLAYFLMLFSFSCELMLCPKLLVSN